MEYIQKTPKQYSKKYKCPYCELRLERDKLASHIEKDHKHMIPEGYTASRVAFNTINHKEVGHCIIDGSETEWNEDKKRYERLCKNPACHKAYVKMVDDRLKKARGVSKSEMLSDPKFQDKMLKGRSISGTYKFSDGGKIPYVGSYEKNFLEFMDKFLHVESKDIQAPGPTIDYYFEGKKHFWITDFYYIPYNLVLDIKDGGSNPNTRDMAVYRAKQNAKEKAIISGKEYNYIRLTDNQFDQLIEIMLDLKDSLMDLETKYSHDITRIKPIVKINEGYIRLLDKYKDPKTCSWDEELTWKSVEDALRGDSTIDKSAELHVYDMNPNTYKNEYIGSIRVEGNNSYDWINQEQVLSEKLFPQSNNLQNIEESLLIHAKNENDIAIILQNTLTDPNTYIKKDLNQLVQAIDSIPDYCQLLNWETFLITAFYEHKERLKEYRRFLESGKCNHIMQPDCECFVKNKVSPENMEWLGNRLKELRLGISKRIQLFKYNHPEGYTFENDKDIYSTRFNILKNTLSNHDLINLSDFDFDYIFDYVL